MKPISLRLNLFTWKKPEVEAYCSLLLVKKWTCKLHNTIWQDQNLWKTCKKDDLEKKVKEKHKSQWLKYRRDKWPLLAKFTETTCNSKLKWNGRLMGNNKAKYDKAKKHIISTCKITWVYCVFWKCSDTAKNYKNIKLKLYITILISELWLRKHLCWAKEGLVRDAEKIQLPYSLQ